MVRYKQDKYALATCVRLRGTNENICLGKEVCGRYAKYQNKMVTSEFVKLVSYLRLFIKKIQI